MRLLKDRALPRPLSMTVACQRANERLLAGRDTTVRVLVSII